ncbi:MAG TPA: ACP S-malonyltransferase [Acetobacteraceae bacterium]|nr:ACP S-malonyltransferase [Acetobacteraceae bacterium]
MSINAFIFPGQGSQSVGMGRELAGAFLSARELFEEVDETLRQNLSKLMFEGPAEALTLTENAQPALMAVSLAVIRVLERDAGMALQDKALIVAGHSLGEFSALAAAGSLTVPAAARLLRRRGEAMQRAVPPGEGAMAALIGADLDQASALCAEAAIVPAEPGGEPSAEREVIAVANDNGGGQVVISGAREAIARAVGLARDRGVKRAMLLSVSAPFHCPLMEPAASELAAALAETELTAPAVPIVSNVTAEPTSDPSEIRELLVRQVTGLVRWRESVMTMLRLGAERFVELGAGKVLSGLVRRIVPDAAVMAAGTPAEIEALIKEL